MCYGSPAKSLEIARSRLTPEQWSRFEREFDDFCVVQGLVRAYDGEHDDDLEDRYDWARWAFFQGRHQRNVKPDAMEVEPIVNAWIRSRGTCMDGSSYTAAMQLATFVAERITAPRVDQCVADVYFEKIGRAMMSDEQAQMSLERWMGRGK